MIVLQCNKKKLKIVEKKPDSKGNYFTQGFRSTVGAGDALYNSFARDLFAIGRSFLLADRAFRRGVKPGMQTRSITVTIPVENISFWTGISREITELVHFVSRDWWELRFVTEKKKYPQKKDWVDNPYDCISLFSDGLDSLGGATALIRDGRRPVFAFHEQRRWNMTNARERIAVVQSLPEMDTKGAATACFQFQVSDMDEAGNRNLFQENSRRSRPFFYLCLAGATALEYRIPEIYLNENGTLALNLPLNAGKVGAPFITRHAHPWSLRLFEGIFQSVWDKCIGDDRKVAVQNPLWEKTKADIVSYLLKSGIGKDEILKTVSCENAARPLATIKNRLRGSRKAADIRNIRECGMCTPCLIKRYSIGANKISLDGGHFAFDDRELLANSKKMLEKILEKYPLIRRNMLLPEEWASFCQKMNALSPSQFVSEYLYELSALVDTEGRQLNADWVLSLHQNLKRFATQYLKYWSSRKKLA